jgi:transglutaminase-like putative cysteine protease
MERGWKARRQLWRAGGSTAAIGLVGGLVVFLLFPRWGIGVFLRGNMARQAHSGFSGEVTLGDFGRIKSDPTVVARLELRGRSLTEPRPTWHLRGASLDVYERGRWTRHSIEPTPSETIAGHLVMAPGHTAVLQPMRRGVGRSISLVAPPRTGFATATEILNARVTLEDIGADALFVASRPLAVRLIPRGAIERQARLLAGPNEEFRAEKPPGPLQYEFIAGIGEPTPNELRAVGEPVVPDSLQPYLQRSPELSADVTQLARRLTAGHESRYDRVQAIVEHLQAFAYSLESTPSERVLAGADPIEGFLFDTRSGHCEYFASALAILLREVGIPTRLVNGYYGAHYNRLGGFYAVRQADAHSWVEVHFGELGWFTFDPTPAIGRTAGDGAPLWPAASDAIDALRNAYLEYVVDFSYGTQLELLDRSGLRQPNAIGSRVQYDRLGWILAVIMGVLALRRLWRRDRTRRRRSMQTRLYLQLVRNLAKKGIGRLPHESPRQLSARVRAAGLDERGALERFADEYERARFGPRAGGDAVEPLRALARAASQALRGR